MVFRVPESVRHSEDTLLVAVMMPFKEAYSAAVFDTISEACRQNHFAIQKADGIWKQPEIIQDIFTLLCQADLVVVDCSGQNANVMYELGIAHTLGKTVVPITQNIQDVPFDIQHHRAIEYDPEKLDDLSRGLGDKLKQFRPQNLTLRDIFARLDAKTSHEHLHDVFGATDLIRDDIELTSLKQEEPRYSQWLQAYAALRESWDTVGLRKQRGDELVDVMADLIHSLEQAESALCQLIDESTTLDYAEKEYYRKDKLEWFDRIFRALIFGALNTWRPEKEGERKVIRMDIKIPPLVDQ